MFGRIGPTELLVIAAIALLVIGPAKIPQFAKAVGQGLGEFRKGLRSVKDEIYGSPADEGEKKV